MNMTVDILLERLKKDLIVLDNKVEEFDLKHADALAANDQNSAAYWERKSNETWEQTKRIRTTILVIKERLGG